MFHSFQNSIPPPMTKPAISIIGCGWLGLPTAQYLLQQGYPVKGSTTTPSKLSILEEKGITPHLLQLEGREKWTPAQASNDIVDHSKSEMTRVCMTD